jgi:hypothetical protein
VREAARVLPSCCCLLVCGMCVGWRDIGDGRAAALPVADAAAGGSACGDADAGLTHAQQVVLVFSLRLLTCIKRVLLFTLLHLCVRIVLNPARLHC